MGRKIPFLLFFFWESDGRAELVFRGGARVKSGNNEHVAVDKSDLSRGFGKAHVAAKKF